MGKRCFFFLTVTTLLIGRALAQPAPTATLTGRITDAVTGQPLPFATVYLNNTTRGTLADAQGVYRLAGVALGTVKLAASFVGYHPAKQALRLTDGRLRTVSLALKPDAALLQAVVVTAQKPRAWQRQFRQFKAALLGETYFAGQCSISNGRMVEFSEKDGHLLATASEPLVIENAALGYRLHYELLHFDLYRFATYYAGISRFEELKPENPAQAARWHRARQRAYEGSTRHLLASLLAGTHEREGFLVHRATFALPTHTQGAVLRSESQPGARVVRSDTLFRPGELPFERELVLSTCLEIFNTRLYTRNSPYPALPYAYSVLYLPQGRAGLTTSGWVSNPDGMEIRGFLGGDRLATLLPADWQPEGAALAASPLAPNRPAPAPDAQLDSLARQHAQRPGVTPIFLHPTKPAYTTGDRLWLSAYVLDPATHQPQSSRIDPNGTEQAPALHVELRTPTGQLVLHQWQPVSKGRAAGTFRLSDSLATGTYRLRAYSEANRDAQQPEFERTIFVQNGVKPPEPVPDSAQLNRLDVQFLPEGGRWVAGLPARLGLKVLDRSGRGLRATAVILDAQNSEVTRLTTNSLGMGSLELTPLPGQRYHALVRWEGFSQNTSLPAVEPEGFTLRAEMPGDSAWIRLRVRASARYDRQAVYVLMKSRGRVHRQIKISLENGTAQAEIPTGSLPAGVCQITLFDATGRPWAERLVFVPEKTPPASLALTAGKPQYQVRERAAFSLHLLDGDGLPMAISGSVSVTDAEQVPADSLSADLRSYLRLTNGLRGRVENPNGYLRDTQPGTLRALDDLLLTQGWRRLSQPTDRADSLGGLTLRGRVLDRRGRPLPLANVILTSTSASQPVAFSARIDSVGEFRMGGLLLRDTVRFRPRVMDNFFKTLDATVRLDASGGQFVPDSTPWPGWRPAPNAWETARLRQQTQPDQYRDGDAQLLAGVTVRAAKLPDDREARRASLHGTADATLLFDENGAQYANVFEMLRGKVAGVQVTGNPVGTSVTIRGIGTLQGDATPLYLLDGVYVDGTQLGYINPAEIERIEVLKNSSAAIYGARGGAGVIAFFSKKAVARKNNRSNPDDLPVYGFPTQRDFYVPGYGEPGGENPASDRRDVLYWNPLLTTTAQGIATIAFPLSDVVRTLRITVQGITTDGEPVAVERVVTVR